MAREQGTATKNKSGSGWGSKASDSATHTVESRKKIRETIAKQIEEFISSGGEIQEVESGRTGDHSVH